MRIIAYRYIGENSVSLDLEYDSKSDDDKKEADEYISRILHREIMLPPDGERQEVI